MGLKCFHTSIFIKTPSLEGLPTQDKEDDSNHEIRLSPAGHQSSISQSRSNIIIIINITIIQIIIIIIILIGKKTNPLFLTDPCFIKINYILGHNTLELYNILVQIRLTTSQTKRDI